MSDLNLNPYLFDHQKAVIDQGPFRPHPGREVFLWVRRLDLIDPVTGGNKWFKLRPHLEIARRKGCSTLLSFGGVYSNHIAALARMGKWCGFRTVGMIRGEQPTGGTVTLDRAVRDGMTLRFVSRADYRNKDSGFIRQCIADSYADAYIIPEGGGGAPGAEGASGLLSGKDRFFDAIAVASGTGITAAGIARSLCPGQRLIAFSVLRDQGSTDARIGNLLSGYTVQGSWTVNHEFHFGGYARTTPELDTFIREFELETAIPVEPVYTGKMFFGLHQLIANGFFENGTKILALHTGGLQYLQPFTNDSGETEIKT